MAIVPAVEARGLTKRYGEVLAVDNLTFSVGEGEVFGLLGPNGAGKTTTIRMLLGLIRPTSGGGFLLGQPAGPDARVLADIGTLVESPAFWPHMSGWDNLRLYWAAGDRTGRDPDYEHALAIAGLGPAIHRKVKTYSHGMRQRLGLAQALLGKPRMVVLDEPTNGLDPQQMREVRHLIRQLADAGATVLLSSHLLAEVEQVCTHALVIDRGRLVASGTVAELTGAGDSVYLEVDDIDAATRSLSGLGGVRDVGRADGGLVVKTDSLRASELVAQLVHSGIAVEHVSSRRRLEDAFVELVSGDHR